MSTPPSPTPVPIPTPSPAATHPQAAVPFDEPRAPRRPGFGISVTLVFWVLVMLVVYVLSIGPVGAYSTLRTGSAFSAGSRTVPWHEPYAKAFYWPLISAGQKWPAVGRPLQRYVSWWQSILGPAISLSNRPPTQIIPSIPFPSSGKP